MKKCLWVLGILWLAALAQTQAQAQAQESEHGERPAEGPVEGELRMELYSFVGSANSSSAQYTRYQLLPNGKLAQTFAGSIRNGMMIPKVQRAQQVPQNPFQIGMTFPDSTLCSDLMAGAERKAIYDYEKRGIFSKNDLATLGPPDQELSRDQVVYVEVKQFTQKVHSPGELYVPDDAHQQQMDFVNRVINENFANQLGGRFSSQSPDYWRVVGTARLVAGQVDGKPMLLPLEIHPEPGMPSIRTEAVRAVFEIGRVAMSAEADLKKVLSMLGQRLRMELVAEQITDPRLAEVYVHAVTPVHVRLYQAMGMKVYWQNAEKSRAVLKISVDEMLKRYPPESVGFKPPEVAGWITKWRSAYEQYVQVKERPPIRLRYFGDAWREGLEIPEAVDAFLKHELLSYRPEDLVLLRHGFMDHLGLGPQFMIQRTAYRSLLRLNELVAANHWIRADVPGRMNAMGFLEAMLIASVAIRDELLAQGVAQPREWLKAREMVIVLHTNDDQLTQGLLRMQSLQELGVVPFKIDRESPHRNYLLLVKPWVLLEHLENKNVEFKEATDVIRRSAGFSLRSSAELE